MDKKQEFKKGKKCIKTTRVIDEANHREYERGKSISYYDPNGDLFKEEELDENGNIVKKSYYNEDDIALVIENNSADVYKYDDKGHLSELLTFTGLEDGFFTSLCKKYEYEYNSQGKIVSAKITHENGTVGNETCEYYVDGKPKRTVQNNGRLIKEYAYEYEYKDGKEVQFTRVTVITHYDEHGEIIKIDKKKFISDFGENGRAIHTKSISNDKKIIKEVWYKYDESENLVYSKSISFGKIVDETFYTYNEHNVCIEKKITNANSTAITTVEYMDWND